MPLPKSTLSPSGTLAAKAAPVPTRDLYAELAKLVQSSKDSLAQAEAFAREHKLSFNFDLGDDVTGTFRGGSYGGNWDFDGYGWQGSNC